MDDVKLGRKIDQGTGYGRRRSTATRNWSGLAPERRGRAVAPLLAPDRAVGTATTRPKKIRLLGEDLILFRDRKGRPGLLYPRCMHRGTTLVLRQGRGRRHPLLLSRLAVRRRRHCLDQPCEPEHGLHRDVARQPWYPVEERYGLVFAYLGPPEKKPVLPRYDILEELGPNQAILARQMGAQTGDGTMPVRPIAGSISTTT